MFKCDNCGKEYEFEECFALLSNDESDADKFFDGEEMRSICPLCGGLIYLMEEEKPAAMPLGAVV